MCVSTDSSISGYKTEDEQEDSDDDHIQVQSYRLITSLSVY